MTARTGYNYVTFTPTDTNGTPSGDGAPLRVNLTMQSSIVLEAGLKPNVWTALIPPAEFLKIQGATGTIGRLSLWFDNSPLAGSGVPNVVLWPVSVVDVEAAATGFMADDPDTCAVTEYRVSFADYRTRFTEPKGGRLRLGLINPKGTAPGDQIPMSQLIRFCLQAIGESIFSVPAGTDDTPPPEDLKWYGNHAPTELQKLLTACGLVYIPGLSDRIGTVQRIGQGATPSFGAEAIPSVQVPAMDLRGKAVIFSSYPNRVVKTRELIGPDVTTWQFVVQNTHDAWEWIHSGAGVDTLEGHDPQETFQTDCSAISEANQNRLRQQLYRFIRLSPDSEFPDGILTEKIETDGTRAKLEVQAKAVIYTNGRWTATVAFAAIPAKFVNGAIIEVPGPLGKVHPSPTTRWPGDFKELENGDLKIRFTMEQSEQDSEGNWRPKYYHVGFRKTGPAIDRMNDEEVANALDGTTPDVFFVNQPAWRLVIDETGDGSTNQAQIDEQAEQLATQYLWDSAATTERMLARGFQRAELSGKVSRIEWDQRALLTTATIGNWYAPDGAIADTAAVKIFEQAEEHPGQKKTSADDQALGTANVAPAVRPVTPTDEPPRFLAGVIPLTLATDGGSDGSASSSPTYTYAANDARNGADFGTGGLSPVVGRAAGKYVAATSGLGHYGTDGNSFVLLVAFEVPRTKTCAEASEEGGG